jgi:hypothetical protein
MSISIPFAAGILSEGTADLRTLAAESFSWLNEHAVFSGNMSLAVFKNAFDVSENPLDVSANLTVTMKESGKKAFVDSLMASLCLNSDRSEDAPTARLSAVTGGAASQQGYQKDLVLRTTNGDGTGSTLREYLESWAQHEIDADLLNNDIAAALEGENVENLAIDDTFFEDVSLGINALWTSMSANTDAAAKGRKLIALQYSNSRYLEQEEAADGSENFVPTLPAKAGDTITFRVVCTQSYTVSEVTEDAIGDIGATDGDGANAEDGPGKGTGYSVENRSINLVLTLV